MNYTIKATEIPVGVYNARFDGIETKTHPEYGEGLCFSWLIVGGKCDGKTAYRTTGTKPTPRNAFGKMLAALAGTSPSDGMTLDADNFIGRFYTIVVEATDNGSTRVGSVMPRDEQPQPQPQVNRNGRSFDFDLPPA